MGIDLLFSIINAVACALIAVAILGAILSHKVRDGIVIKVGLICLMAGFAGIALKLADGGGPDDMRGLERALLLVNCGVAIVILGYLRRKESAPRRRASDFVDLDEDHLSQASGGRK